MAISTKGGGLFTSVVTSLMLGSPSYFGRKRSGHSISPRLTRMAKTTRAVPGRPVRQMPKVAAADMSSDRPAPAKATHVRFSAIGVGSENRRCRNSAVANSTAENTAIRLVQRAKNDGPRGGGGLMRGAASRAWAG